MSKNQVTQRKAKNILPSPLFQLKLLSYFFGLFTLTTISLYSTTYLFFWRFKNKALSVGIPDGHIFFKFLQGQKDQLDYVFIGLVIFNFILLATIGFIVSHRLAGPILKIKNHLETLDSNTPDLKLRDTDFFKELEPIINNLKRKIK